MKNYYKFKKPENKKKNYLENFFIKKGLKLLVDLSKEKNSVNKIIEKSPIKPNLDDLYNLYQYILINKRITVLEFGSGWSTLVLSLALKELRDIFFKKVKLLRKNNLFELFVVENEKKYLNITKNRIKYFNKFLNIKNPIKITYLLTDVEMTEYNGKICTQYKKLPLCNPDFVYLDGPGQFKVIGEVNGISTRHKDMMPMSCDILKYEYFFTPGTIIVVDGRSANTKFLKDNLKRKWDFSFDKKNDQYIFCLADKALGKYNQLQLNFYNKYY